MNFALVSIFIVALFSCAPLPANVSDQAYPQTELTAQVDELFTEWDTEDSPGAAIGIFNDGRIIYARGYGVANLDYGIPLVPQSVLRIGSISKQFVAMCIAILAEQEKLSFDDDIRTYLPEMPDYGEPITIRHLLHHTSGIREYLTLVDTDRETRGERDSAIRRESSSVSSPGSRGSISALGKILVHELGLFSPGGDHHACQWNEG